ncbi:hypothetical protein OROHE_012586 [Orobanche hederae]
MEESLKVDEEDKGDKDEEFEAWLVGSAIDTVGALKELKEIGSDGGLKMLRDLGFQPPPMECRCHFHNIWSSWAVPRYTFSGAAPHKC